MRLFRALSLRILYGVISLLFVSLVTFVAGEIAPGNPAQIIAGEKASAADIQRVAIAEGLDRPWFERYLKFAGSAARGDFGRSYFGGRTPVSEIVRQNLPMTLTIASFAILLASGIGIFLGTVAAAYKNRFPDGAALSLSTLGVTVPNFVLAPILVYIFGLQLGKVPITWEVDRRAPLFYYLVLPVVILAARPMALLTRLTRASMIDTMQQEFIRLAVAKGVPPLRLYISHALRNAILPVVTAIGTSFGFLLTGSFIVETAFNLPGLGFTAINAVQKRDTPVVLATTLIAGALFILINLIVDLLLPLLDPRIREAQV